MDTHSEDALVVEGGPRSHSSASEQEDRSVPEMLTNDDALYAVEIVKTICTEVGPGLPGSVQEGKRAAIIAKELVSHLGAGNVVVEEFSMAPGAFVGAYPIGALLTLAAALLNMATGRLTGALPWVTAVAALAFSALALLQYVFEFILYSELLDPLFPQKQSTNVIGTLRNPETRVVKRLLILSGHHDSASENTWLRLLGYGFFFATATIYLGFITMAVMSIIQLAGMIAGNAGIVRFGTLGWVLWAFPIVPSVIFALFFTRAGKNGGVVPGAVDNLAASAVAVALCRFLVNHPAYVPADTEIRFVSFGSEEAGVRGSRRYAKRHLEELRRLDARLLNFEMIAFPEITILSSDLNGAVKASPEMVKSVVAAAERAGVPFKVKSAVLGTGTDAGRFSQAGLKATTLIPFKMPQQMVAFYHQKWDSPEVLTTEPLLNVLKLSFEWIRSGGE